MPYPKVLSETATVQHAVDGYSLARYGDGELAIILGANCISQRHDKSLAEELAMILREPIPGLLPCIPNIHAKGTKKAWQNYQKPEHLALYRMPEYGSSFITRPDSAPWIDTEEYWGLIRQIWAGRYVTLLTGGKNGLRADQLVGAQEVREIHGPWEHAWKELRWIEGQVGNEPGLLLMSLGPAATALAARYARRGIQAVDLGHIGMFMRHAGAYRFRLDDLISPAYRALMLQKHVDKKKWGGDGADHVKPVRDLMARYNCLTVLDYGCGIGTLGEALKPQRVLGFDPGVPGRDELPKPCDLVVCTDVLENIEPDRLDNVLRHIRRVAAKAIYFVIATREAREKLADGRNAHLIVEDAAWWLGRISGAGFEIDRWADEGKEIKLWCTPRASDPTPTRSS